MKNIYILLMRTGTIPSKFVSLFTMYKYSHVALSLDEDCDELYSFGRKKVNSFLSGGFVITHKDGEFFQKFNKTKCIIYKLPIESQKYYNLKKDLNNKKKNNNKYKYDFLGIILRYFYIPITFKDKYVCSYFVADILEKNDIYHFDKKTCFINPRDFNNIKNLEKKYQGYYLDYK